MGHQWTYPVLILIPVVIQSLKQSGIKKENLMRRLKSWARGMEVVWSTLEICRVTPSWESQTWERRTQLSIRLDSEQIRQPGSPPSLEQLWLSQVTLQVTSYQHCKRLLNDVLSVLILFHLGLLVKVTPPTVTEGQKVTLTCSTTCTLTDNPNPPYIWKKNRQRLTNPKTKSNYLYLDPGSSEDTGRYSCAVNGHENLPSAEETLTVRCK